MNKALTTSRIVKPITSTNSKEARAAVLSIYKKFQRHLPVFWWDYELTDIPLPVFRETIKNQFLKNQHIKDIRIIDRKVYEANEHLKAIKLYFYNPYMIRNMLYAENNEPKPKDFLSCFLQGKN